VRDFQAFRKPPPPGPVELERLVPPDSDCLWIKAGLDRADLSFLTEGKGTRGGAPYDPRAMLGVLLLAYVEGRTGSGTIAQACRRDVCYMHVSGRQTPDARTVRRFRAALAPLMEEAFRRVVAACAQEGLLPMRLVAVDERRSPRRPPNWGRG
jgi:transposase